MTRLETSQAIEERLRQLADPARAVPMRAYLLDQFAFLGVPAPTRRSAVKDLMAQPAQSAEEVLAIAEDLWQLPEREFRYTAIDFLKRHARLLGPPHLPAIKQLLMTDAWWETVDGLAPVAGAIVRANPRLMCDASSDMDHWVEDSSMWVRRAAMLHQLGWRLDTDQRRLAAYSRLLADDADFFIRKAIGWALRDYARWNPTFVENFVADYRARLSSLTIREACRKLAIARRPATGQLGVAHNRDQ